jgi:YfiH family protein
MGNVSGRMPPSASRATTRADATGELSDRDGITLMTWGRLASCGVEAVVTGRDGGVSTGPYRSLNLGLHVGDDDGAVLENRRRALGALGAGLDQLVVADQVHGIGATVVTGVDAGRGARKAADALAATDALVTAESGVVLAVLVADCAPVVLFDPDARVLACVHAGWRGALGGVVESALGAMTGLGARTERILAGIGPAVDPDRYEVGGDVVDACLAHLGGTEPWARPGRPGHWWFDLPGVVEEVLRRAGLRDDHIAGCGRFTGPPGPFYSYRAEGTCGRFALLARVTP